MVENDNRPKKSSTRGQKTPDNAKKLNFKILRSRDYDTGFLFAVHKLNSSCNLLLAAHWHIADWNTNEIVLHSNNTTIKVCIKDKDA